VVVSYGTYARLYWTPEAGLSGLSSIDLQLWPSLMSLEIKRQACMQLPDDAYLDYWILPDLHTGFLSCYIHDSLAMCQEIWRQQCDQQLQDQLWTQCIDTTNT
jgi:hypothetical protein